MATSAFGGGGPILVYRDVALSFDFFSVFLSDSTFPFFGASFLIFFSSFFLGSATAHLRFFSGAVFTHANRQPFLDEIN